MDLDRNVFFHTTLGTGLARTGTNTGTPAHKILSSLPSAGATRRAQITVTVVISCWSSKISLSNAQRGMGER